MKKILFLTITVFCVLTKNFAQEWITFNSNEGKFTAMLPSQPTIRLDTSKTYPRSITKLFISQSTNDIFIIGWVDYDSSYKFNEQSELNANRDNFIEAINGTLVDSKNIDFNGYKGLEFSASSSAFFWTSKVFIVGKRPYQLLAGSNTGKRSENENKFYNSFSIKK